MRTNKMANFKFFKNLPRNWSTNLFLTSKFTLLSYLVQGSAVDLDEPLSALAVSHGGGGLLATENLHRGNGFDLLSHLVLE